MSASAIFGARVPAAPISLRRTTSVRAAPRAVPAIGGGAMPVIECSSRPQKKSTAHHKKTRPRKSQPWDIRRRPTVYAPLPPLPPDWTVVGTVAEASDAAEQPSEAQIE